MEQCCNYAPIPAVICSLHSQHWKVGKEKNWIIKCHNIFWPRLLVIFHLSHYTLFNEIIFPSWTSNLLLLPLKWNPIKLSIPCILAIRMGTEIVHVILAWKNISFDLKMQRVAYSKWWCMITKKADDLMPLLVKYLSHV